MKSLAELTDMPMSMSVWQRHGPFSTRLLPPADEDRYEAQFQFRIRQTPVAHQVVTPTTNAFAHGLDYLRSNPLRVHQMLVKCAVCKSVQPDVMTNMKTPFCLTQGPCGSVRRCRDDTVTLDTCVQGKMSHP